MAGFNPRGGNARDYVLGRGKVFLSGDIFRSVSGAVSVNPSPGWRDVGNVTQFTITQESEVKEHRSFLQGIQTIDLEVPVSQKMSIGFTVDEINASNFARFMNGQLLAGELDQNSLGLANAAAIASDNAVTGLVPNYFVDTDVNDQVFDVWYDLSLFMVDNLFRAYDFEPQANQAITVRKGEATRTSTANAPLTEGTHYEIDRRMGRIRFFNVAGGLARGDTIQVRWAAPSTAKSAGLAGTDDSLFIIQPLVNSGVTVGLKFIQENANDGDLPLELEFWKVKLKPDGEFAGIGDDWASLAFTGVCETVSPAPAYGSPYGRITGRKSFAT